MDESIRLVWDAFPQLFLSGRPYYRFELPPAARTALAAVDPRIRQRLEDSPKVAVGTRHYLFAWAVAEEAGRQRVIGRNILVTVDGAGWSVDSLVGK